MLVWREALEGLEGLEGLEASAEEVVGGDEVGKVPFDLGMIVVVVAFYGGVLDRPALRAIPSASSARFARWSRDG